MYVLRPGATSSPRNLDLMLRRRHELEREALLRERQEREDLGVPLSEDAPWYERAKEALTAAGDATDRQALGEARVALAQLQAALGDPLPDPGEYEEDPQAATLWVRFRALSREEHLDRLRAISEAIKASGLGQELEALLLDYVAASVHAVEGFEDEHGTYGVTAKDGRLQADALEVLRLSGLLHKIYICARDFQTLEGDEKKAFGQRAPTTCSTSASAPAALSTSEGSGAAAAAPTLPIGPAPSTKMTPALAATSSITHGWTQHTTSTSPPTAGSSAQTG